MATTGTNDRALAGACGVALLLAMPFAHAEFSAEVTAGLSYIDNVRLEAENEDSELIWRLEPSFHYFRETSAVTISGDYLMQAFRYQDLSETDVYHQFRGSLRAALVPDRFFMEVGGSRSQSIVDPSLTIPFSNLPISGNRQDRDEYYALPSFQYGFGNDVAVSGSYRHSWVQHELEGTEDNQQAEGRFSLDNYRKERGLTWALRYDWERTEYELEVPWEYQKAMAELGLWVGTNTRIFAAAGRESAWDNPLDPSMEDKLWEAGFSHEVGERLRAEFAVGERSFGDSWRGDLELRFRHGSTRLSYAETPTTEGRVRLRRSVFDVTEIPEDFLDRPGQTERFIARSLLWTLNLELRRTTVSLTVFDTEHTERTEANGTPRPDEAQRGTGLSVIYGLGARTDLRLGGSWADRDLESGGSSEVTRGLFAIDYRLGQKTVLAFSYIYAEEDPVGLTTVRDYTANTVSLDLIRTF